MEELKQEKDITRTPVTSSNVKSIGFCADRKCIDVEYSSGVYRYHDCSQDEFDALLQADKTEGASVGKLIHKTIKPKKFTKLG